jgi:hypothetical protein
MYKASEKIKVWFWPCLFWICEILFPKAKKFLKLGNRNTNKELKALVSKRPFSA